MRKAHGFLVTTLTHTMDTQAVHQLIKSTEEIDDGHELEHAFVVQPQLLRRRSVNGQSVIAAVYR